METKIMVGADVLKNHGELKLSPISNNTFTFELHLVPVAENPQQLAGKEISIWIRTGDGKKHFLTGTIGQTSLLQTPLADELTISGTIKERLYLLSMLMDYRPALVLSVAIPLSFLYFFVYRYNHQSQNLLKQTGTIEEFTRLSGGARSPAIYKFKTKEQPFYFERRYEGLSRFVANDIRSDLYLNPENPNYIPNRFALKRQLKPVEQRQYSWYIDREAVGNIDKPIPYIYLRAIGQKYNKFEFYYDLYAFVCFKTNFMVLHIISFLTTFFCLVIGLRLKSGKNTFWKAYIVCIALIFFILLII